MDGVAWVRAAIAVLACAASVGLFFRHQILSGFGHVFGDMVDGRIEIALLEHWYNTFSGLEAWRQPIFFYPTPGILGYNDGYFLFGLLYSAWRSLGADPFLATDLVNVVMRATGFAAFLLFAQRPCHLPFRWAVLGATIFTLSNAAFLQIPHAQLLSIAFVPLFGWLLWTAAEALLRHEALKAAAWGCAAALLFDAWLMTAFYMAWFTVLFILIMGAAALITMAMTRRFADWRCWLRMPRWPALTVLIVLAAGMIPFVMTYLPVLRITGMHSAAAVIEWTPTPFDLVNTGAHNLFYGGLNRWLQRTIWPDAHLQGELTIGMPPLLLIFTLCGAGAAWFRTAGSDRTLWRIISAAFVISVVLALQIHHHTLWVYIYDFVPGAAAVRAVSRYMLFLSFPGTLLAVYGLARCSRRWPLALAGLAGLILMAEQINLLRVDRIPRWEETRFLAGFPPPPPACKAFVVVAARVLDTAIITPDLQPYIRNVDGMLIAELVHIPTLNGHASFLPAGFALGPSDELGDTVRARSYAAARDLGDDICGLDTEKMVWLPAPLPASLLPLGQPVRFGMPAVDAAPYLARGWSGAEQTGRWTEGPEAVIDFAAPVAGQNLTVALRGQPFSLGGPPSRISVFANGHALADWNPSPAPQTFRATIPAAWIAPHGNVSLRLIIASPRRPIDIPLDAGQAPVMDRRQLGLWVESLVVTAGSRSDFP